jgi:TonB family protein
MSSAIPAHIYGKRPSFIRTTLSILILCLLAPATQAVAALTDKTDAELTKQLIGTWELPLHRRAISKRFLIYNADGTSKAIRLTNNLGSPRRLENEGTWRVSHGYLMRDVAKSTHDINTPFKVRCQIESIGNEIVKLRNEDGSRDELRRISQLPSLPPLLQSPATWVPEMSAAERAEIKKAVVSSPQPVYPTIARQRRIQGSGIFRLIVAVDGRVESIQIIQSTGSKILDDAAEKALRQWRFKPGALTGKVNVPISFTLTRGRARSRAIAPEGVL